jgi:Icc protein
MAAPLLIAQITDLHIGPSPISARNTARLAGVVARLMEIGPDLVVATGDLTDGGAPASYATVKALLAPFQDRMLLAIGNHDQRHDFLSAFPEFATADGFIQHRWASAGRRILVLDTMNPGQHGGHYCDARAAWLRARLAEDGRVPTLIALHHPPVRSGVAWMDTGADGAWKEKLDAILRGKSQIVGVIAGHLHRTLSTRFAGHSLTVAPSVAAQVALDLSPLRADQPDNRPLIEDSAPGFALHLWSDEGVVSHFEAIGDTPVLARFDDSTRGMIQDMIKGPRS